MTSISSILGKPDAALKSQVEKTTGPIPEIKLPISSKDDRQPVQPKTGEPSGKPLHEGLTSSNSDSYTKTLEVAEKLQSRIDEVASAPHKVSIRQDETSQQYVIQIQDPDGEVVKQIPSEKVLNLHHKLDDLSGMVIDEMI